MVSFEWLVRLAKSARSRFQGVYPDYQSALNAIPPTRRAGYDHDEAAGLYRQAIDTVRDSDYPALFWLDRIVGNSRKVFDWGGNIGVTYYKFSRYLSFPPSLTWTVCDLPAICRAGEAFAAERGASLRFTTRFEECSGADVLIAFGAIQYIPEPLPDLLERLPQKPPHILINRIPLFEGSDFATLEDIGKIVCPYQVFNRDRWIQGILRNGYELVDSWHTPDLSCSVRWHPGHSMPAQSGVYFRRIQAAKLVR